MNIMSLSREQIIKYVLQGLVHMDKLSSPKIAKQESLLPSKWYYLLNKDSRQKFKK